MATVTLNLLGKPEISVNGNPLSKLHTAKTEALLYYLAVTGQPHTREVLADFLWPTMVDAQARRNLTQSLSAIRRLIGDVLATEGQHVLLTIENVFDLDVWHFQTAIEANQVEPHDAELADAITLYRGDFLEGLSIRDALPFEEWLLAERERLQGLMLLGLQALIDLAFDNANYSRGVNFSRQILKIEPWRESAHRQMMMLLVRMGRREAALAQYEVCRQMLAEELGVEPSPETVRLYDQLKDVDEPHPNNLPITATPFIGRNREINRVLDHLNDANCRLLTLVGPGGIGKTRLAIATAAQCLMPILLPSHVSYFDGVYFVDLASVTPDDVTMNTVPKFDRTASLISSAIANALHFDLQGIEDPKAQLIDYLQDRRMLLVLDNFEHLVDAAPLLSEILRAAAGITLLVTSRERLYLQEEWIQPVDGLSYPSSDWLLFATTAISDNDSGTDPITIPSSLIADLEKYDAVALFCQQARRTRPDFELTETEAQHVLRLCQMVEGAPLALELAASWLRVLSCAEVIIEIEQSLDFLTSTLRNVPERHRSMRAIFDRSWLMLSTQEQLVFSKLSIFRGGFERTAAREIADTSLTILTSLVDKSFLRHSQARNRYDVHELLRQFSAEKYAENDVDKQATRQQYWIYYLNFISQNEAKLNGETPQQAIADIQVELDNVRQAWQWAVAQMDIRSIKNCLAGLSRFYDLVGYLQEGEEVFRSAAAYIQEQSAVSEQSTRSAILAVVVRLLAEQARLLNRRGYSEKSIQVMATAASLADMVQDVTLRAVTYHQWGESLCYHSDLEEAQTQLEMALSLAQSIDLGHIEAESLRHLAICADHLGDPTQATALYQQALDCFRRIGDRRGENLTLTNLGLMASNRGDFIEAQRYHEQSLQGFQSLNYQWGQGVVLDNLGTVHYDQGNFSTAERLLSEGLVICREIKDLWGEGYILNSLGNVHRALGNYGVAQDLYEQALQLRLSIEARQDVGYTLAEWALLNLQIGNQKIALEQSQQTLEISREVNIPALEALGLTHLGHAQLVLGLSGDALQTYQQALKIHHELNEHQAIEGRMGLVRAHMACQQRPQALEQVELLLPHIAHQVPNGLRQTFLLHLTCVQVLQAFQDKRATSILESAYQQLQARAAGIENETLRETFLTNVSFHNQLIQMFEKQV